MRLYLAHPWQWRERVREWELEFETRTGVELVNPFFDLGHNETNVDDFQTIVSTDLSAISVSDGIVCFMDDVFSIGTHMELFYAATTCLHEQKFGHETIYVIADERVARHPWVRWCSQINPTFTSLDAFEKWFVDSRPHQK